LIFFSKFSQIGFNDSCLFIFPFGLPTCEITIILEFLSSKNLIITGGCALNKQANQKIEEDWRKIYVPKNPGDPGSCVGAVLTKIKKQVDYNDKIWYTR